MSINSIDFLTPKPIRDKKTGKPMSALAMKRSGGLDFSLKPQEFKKQFRSAAGGVARLAEPRTLQLHILASALNCGYGGASKELLALGETDWKKLQRYQRAKGALLLSVIDRANTLPDYFRLSAFRSVIEASESSDIGYLYGSVMCRLANEVWARKYRKADEFRYFWHVKVALDKAVSLTKRVRIKGTVSDAENPDFLLKLKKAGWFTCEAKGTLGDIKWGDIREGLQQATKFERVQVFDLAARVRRSTSSIRGSACTMAYFSKMDGGALRVAHVDPEPGADEAAETIRIVPQFASLVAAEQAMAQFEGLANRGQGNDGRSSPLLPGYRWQPLMAGTGTSRMIWIGIPAIYLSSRPQLHEALSTLRAVVPYVAKMLHETPGSGSARADLRDDEDLLSRLNNARGEAGPPIYQRVIDLRQKADSDLLDSEGGRAILAHALLRELFRSPILSMDGRGSQLATSIRQLHDDIVPWQQPKAKLHARLNAKLSAKPAGKGAPLVRHVSNGLLLLDGSLDLNDFKKVKVVKI